jgi:hypothetical protein
VERKLVLRNVVCRGAAVSPSAFDVDGFAQGLDLGAYEDKVLLADISVTEWEKIRLQILPDRLQLGFKETAGGELVKRATEDFLARADDLAPSASIRFNAALRLKLGKGDPDPSEKLFDADALASALGGEGDGRGGVTLVFRDKISRWWIELSPLPDQDNDWTFDFNRRFADFPDPGSDRDKLLDWFANVEADLVAQFETISLGADR